MQPRKISLEEAKELMDALPCVLLDVREEYEYMTGHAIGAKLLPVDSITRETAENVIAHPDMPVLVYCKTGARSFLAAQKLSALGYTNVHDIGSLVGWPYGISYEREE